MNVVCAAQEASLNLPFSTKTYTTPVVEQDAPSFIKVTSESQYQWVTILLQQAHLKLPLAMLEAHLTSDRVVQDHPEALRLAVLRSIKAIHNGALPAFVISV